MSTPFEPVDGQSLDEAVLERLLNNTGVNVLSDAEKAKLAGIESSATADQTGTEIVQAIDSELGSTDWQSGGGGGGAVDSVNGEVGVVVLDADDIDDSATANKFTTAAEISKLSGIEAGATTDQTGTEIVQAIDTELGQTDWKTGGGGSPEVSSGSGAPASAPSATNLLYIDIGANHRILYHSTGTASVSDWEIVSGFVIQRCGGSHTLARVVADPNVVVYWVDHGTSDPDNALDDDIIAGPGRGVLSTNTQNGATYELQLSDLALSVDMTSGSANTVTIPASGDVDFPLNSVITITQLGAGTTSITAATGVTLDGTLAHTIAIDGIRKGVMLRKIGADEWMAIGEFT